VLNWSDARRKLLLDAVDFRGLSLCRDRQDAEMPPIPIHFTPGQFRRLVLEPSVFRFPSALVEHLASRQLRVFGCFYDEHHKIRRL